MCETLTSQTKKKQNTKNTARGTNVTNSQKEHRENSARDINVTTNQTEHRENSARNTIVPKMKQNTEKTVREAPT